MNLADVVLTRGQNSAPAVFQNGTVLTYENLRQRVLNLAVSLLERGYCKGDRIGIYSENNLFFIVAYLGIVRAGLVAVPLQTEIVPQTLKEIVSTAGIRELLVSKRMSNQLSARRAKLGIRLTPEKDGVLDHDAGGSMPLLAEKAARFPEIDPARDLAALMFTSGSTGAPKGVMVTHRNIEQNSADIIDYLGLTASDRAMVVLPFHYCFGLSLLHTHLMAGGSVVLNNDFKLYPETVLRDMQEKECTGLAGVPSTYQILLRKSRFRQMSFPALRWLQQAGGKLPNTCIGEIINSFPHVRYFLMYGQTEGTARLSYLPPDNLLEKLGSIGKGLRSTRLEVLKPDGTPVAPGSEEVGEIVASGDNIALGYWNDPEETAKFFRDDKLHTGDIARVDEEGFIFIVEREREMIKSGGNRISAKEIEEVIAEIPAVVEVAVVGTPHELLGEAIVACIVPAPGANLSSRDIETHCRKRLPAFKAPQQVILLQNLPHNGSGKVLKPKLKEMLAGRPGGTGGEGRN